MKNMNKRILETEVEYTVALLRQGLKLLDTFGSGDHSESPLCFCLYNGLERLLKIGIMIETGKSLEKEDRTHNICKLYEKFLGEKEWKEISSTEGLLEWTITSEKAQEKHQVYKNEYLLLKELDEFANAKEGRYKNLENLFNLIEKPYTYAFKVLKQTSIQRLFAMARNIDDFPPNNEFQPSDFKIDISSDRKKAVKIALYNILEPIQKKFHSIGTMLLEFNSFLEEFNSMLNEESVVV